MARTPTKRESQLNVILSKDLHSKFKSKTALTGKSMLRVLVEFIENYVKED